MKITSSFSPGDYSRVHEVTDQLIYSLFKETDRGAIIIGAIYVEDELE